MKLSIKRNRKLKSISLYVNDIKTNVYTMASIYAASMADQNRMFRNMASIARRIESGEIVPYKYSRYKTEEQVWNHFDQCITIVWRHSKSVTLSREEFISLRKQGKISGNIIKLAVGSGMQGQTYAIPTKDGQLRTLPLHDIRKYVVQFLDFARHQHYLQFLVTRVGCGLAGYEDAQIALMFRTATRNVVLPYIWNSILCRNN